MSASALNDQINETAASVRAPLNYLASMSEAPYTYAYEAPVGTLATNRKTVAQVVPIHDARPIAEKLTLDREGFAFVREPSAVKDFYDDDEVRRVYYPECERILKHATGGSRVVVFDHIVRNSARAGKNGIKLPAKGVHNDYTIKSGPQRVRDFFPEDAEALLKHRFAIINVWRPVRGPVRESPLAVCDAESIRENDFVASALIYPHRRGEILSVNYNPNHRWFYIPAMHPDEAWLLKCFDSATDGRARYTAHTGFDDPTSAPDAPPRESIETRAFVFFGEESA